MHDVVVTQSAAIPQPTLHRTQSGLNWFFFSLGNLLAACLTLVPPPDISYSSSLHEGKSSCLNVFLLACVCVLNPLSKPFVIF